MTKQFFFIAFIALLGFTSTHAQQDDVKAKAILDRLSTKTKTYTSIKATFEYTIHNQAEDIKETQKGDITIKGNKYLLRIPGQKVACDGKSMFSYIEESDEIQINNMPDEEDEEYIAPDKIFSIYEDGFKYQFVKEVSGTQTVKLFPENPKEKGFHRIELDILKSKNQISKVRIYGKDGTNMTYKVLNFIPNNVISDKKFIISKSTYPNAEVIDLRD